MAAGIADYFETFQFNLMPKKKKGKQKGNFLSFVWEGHGVKWSSCIFLWLILFLMAVDIVGQQINFVLLQTGRENISIGNMM